MSKSVLRLETAVHVDTLCDAFARARLLQVAERNSRGEYQITAGSIAHAKRLDFSAEATLTRLRQHHHDEIPPLLEVMIRNWHGRAIASLETLCVVTVPDAVAAKAIRQSSRFQPYLVRFLPHQFRDRPRKPYRHTGTARTDRVYDGVVAHHPPSFP